MTKPVIYGISKIGPGHIRTNLPNQDSFFVKNFGSYSLLVISDGMGSKKHAELGSKATCISVYKALVHYIYTERKKKLVKILEQRYKENSDLVKFIELVCKGKLKIRNRSKKDIKVDMDGYKLPMELISTPMSKCTIEERDELLKQNEEMKKELEYIRNTTEKQMYLNDLNNLKKEIEKDFK